MNGNKLLIVSYFFAPMNRIGAVRPTKLAKYLTRMGYEVTVICGAPADGVIDPLLARDRAELHAVHEITERNWIRWFRRRKAAPTGQGPATEKPSVPKLPAAQAPANASAPAKGFKARLVDNLYRYLAYRADVNFGRRACRFLRRQGEAYDAVFASYGPLSSQIIGRYCKRNGVAKRWIADFRDEARFPFRWQRRAQREYIRAVREQADVITAAAPAYSEMTGVKDRGVTLYNGFDREDLSAVEPARQTDDRAFTLLYCGTMFAGDTDLGPVLRCLHELIAEGSVAKDCVRVQYVGTSDRMFWEQANAADVAEQCVSLGSVSRQAALQAELAADALLLAARNDQTRHGVIKGKYLEYLMVGKPILCCVTGELPDSEIARHIREGRVGYCYEQAAGEASREGLRAYLLALYRRALAGEPLLEDANADYVRGFEYAALAKQLAALLENEP